jgi:hypothetical protein
MIEVCKWAKTDKLSGLHAVALQNGSSLIAVSNPLGLPLSDLYVVCCIAGRATSVDARMIKLPWQWQW